MTQGFDLSNYVDVAERIQLFADKHPQGSLQVEVLRWPEDGFPFVAVRAFAYRTPDDLRPGVDVAWENFPGKTPYTRESELQNASTSAIGRAIVAVLAADTKRGIASRQEVQRVREGRAAQPKGTREGSSSAVRAADEKKSETPPITLSGGAVTGKGSTGGESSDQVAPLCSVDDAPMFSGELAFEGGPKDKWVCSKCGRVQKKAA